MNPKETLIKDGLQTGKHAYPTLDDIKSDWSEKDEKDQKKKEIQKSTQNAADTPAAAATQKTAHTMKPPTSLEDVGASASPFP